MKTSIESSESKPSCGALPSIYPKVCLLKRFTTYACILSLLFLVILHYMSKLFLGLHCAGESYTHLLKRRAKGQVNDTARVSQL